MIWSGKKGKIMCLLSRRLWGWFSLKGQFIVRTFINSVHWNGKPTYVHALWKGILTWLLFWFSSDVSYTLYDSETQLDSVISFNSHHTLHKRQSGSGNDSTTASPSQTSTPEYTEKEVRPCQKVAPHKNDTTFCDHHSSTYGKEGKEMSESGF